MNNVASKPWTLATIAVVTAACLAAVVLVSVPVAEAQQSTASEAEIAARVRAELEAQMALMKSQMAQRLAELESLREVDLQNMQRHLDTVLNEARLRQLNEQSALHSELQGRSVEEAMRRAEEVHREAMMAAEQAVRRAGRYNIVGLSSGCNAFGEQVLGAAEDLGLSDDQTAQIREAQRANRRDGIERKADIEVGQMDLEGLYDADEPDLMAIRTTLEELAMLQVDDQMAGLNLRQQVLQILTPAQREQYDDMRGDDDVHVIISGAGSNWSVSRFGC